MSDRPHKAPHMPLSANVYGYNTLSMRSPDPCVIACSLTHDLPTYLFYVQRPRRGTLRHPHGTIINVQINRLAAYPVSKLIEMC
jgi:hypothetical protein